MAAQVGLDRAGTNGSESNLSEKTRVGFERETWHVGKLSIAKLVRGELPNSLPGLACADRREADHSDIEIATQSAILVPQAPQGLRKTTSFLTCG